jgi:hypothetical protein
VYRSGEHRVPGPEDEPQRIILYLKGAILDLAERLTEKTESATVQEYCADLLARAVEIERLKHHVAEIEAKRGVLEGFKEITRDAGYLAEWQERSGSGPVPLPDEPSEHDPGERRPPGMTVPSEVLDSVLLPRASETVPDPTASAPESAAPEGEEPAALKRTTIRLSPSGPAGPPVILERVVSEVLDHSALAILWSNVAPRDEDPEGFLPTLRRGRSLDPARVSTLLAALGRIEAEYRGSALLDRGLAYALHRLSLEAQVLLTEAWPGVFDERTVGAIRAVQERVDRILSGQGIHDRQTDEAGPAEEHS